MSTKKDLIAKLKAQVEVYIEQRLDTFRNAVNEATEVNMQRVGGWFNSTSYALDFQTDRLSALLQLTLDKLEISPEEFKAEVTRQKALRIEAYRKAKEEYAAKAKEEADAAEAKEGEDAEAVPLTEEEAVLSASQDPIMDPGPQGDHPPEAQIFGG